LLRCRGAFYSYYIKEKERYQERYLQEGVRIVPASNLPIKDGKRHEPEGVISEGHVHNQALRKMIKLFLACLWLEWRKAAGLPVRPPYAVEKQGHTTLISPEEMVDR
jgi:hypothetical protein